MNTPAKFIVVVAFIAVVVVAILSLPSMLNPTKVHSETFTAPGFTHITKSLELSKGNVVKGNVTVLKRQHLGIQFQVYDPNQNRILSINIGDYSSFTFEATFSGVFVMYFWNREDNLTVMLTYIIK